MSFGQNSQRQSALFAQQSEIQDEASQAQSAAPATGISLSDSTRLGPYSVLLKDAFEESQSEKILELNEGNATLSGADIVAIERSLTPAEKQQGLSQQTVTREKIALIVSPDNPFQGTLTLEQVAGIFRGEITNWRQLGGEDRPLRLIHRSQQNTTRQALETYGVLSGASFETDLDADQDTTADVVERLGSNGISYAPASETIEQFNTRVITIDNVGVNDGRYPFSLPLNYVYQSNPAPDVQGFLDFLQSPDAQSAIEFAQSQPADPTRPLTAPSLEALGAIEKISNPEVSNPEVSNPVDPGRETGASEPNRPEAEISQTVPLETAPSASTPPRSDGLWSGLPFLIVALGMGLLAWLTYMRTRLEQKRKRVPRPAPNYAARLNAQGSNRDRKELQAIAAGPFNSKSQPAKTGAVELSLDASKSEQSESESAAQVAHQDLNHTFDHQRSDEDITTLQTGPDDVIAEDITTLQAAPTQEAKAMDQPSVSDETHFDDEDKTTIQASSPGARENRAAPIDDAAQIDDATVLQSQLSAEKQPLDPLTGQLDAEQPISLSTQEPISHSEEDTAAETSPVRTTEAQETDTLFEENPDPWE